ncbi:DUF5947 family protein [Anaeromyxobacter oryzae]|uniref:Uncharacterized protein n=1 Tax=Anaeromyxobacter oryzae TaxID=2918170 RepID=A0ABM7WPH7_9BACT|nr:DUF5947 family protein [Anaeromyxobacter oryzae]BDG01372.1 hypothetical protein AMOR_03680 [Anaeromyxobacter oryzae]
MTALAALARFARPPPRAPDPQEEACELCSAPAGPGHPHVVDLDRHTIRCACTTCGRLFVQPAAGTRFRTIPSRVLSEPGFELTEADWAALEVPVRLAFLFRSTAMGRWVAVYPGPAGAIESALPLDAWSRIAARSRLASCAEPDVEALLVRGEPAAGPGVAGAGRLQMLLVPIDRCYALAGRLRSAWRGFDGGPEARRAIDAAFAELSARARPVLVAPPGTGGGRS